MNKLVTLFTLAFTLTGCELYFGKNKSAGDDEGRPPGWNCSSDAECAAGCYCDKAPGAQTGECAEAGFCDSNADCPDGYVCDDRSSCVPGTPPTPCTADADCPAGAICGDAGVCEASCVCATDAEAQAAGWDHCDESRGTCETANAWGTCGGDATCGTEPTCPEGAVGLIDPATSCWTGECTAIVACDVTPICEHYQSEAACFDPNNGSCTASYTGINCTKADGSACQSGDTGCTCESFRFASCHSGAN
jgi:hypothetical protein